MNKRKAKEYILRLKSHLRWAGRYVRVVEPIPIDWGGPPEEYLTHMEALEAEVFRVSGELGIVVAQLIREGRHKEHHDAMKCLKMLAKHVERPDGF